MSPDANILLVTTIWALVAKHEIAIAITAIEASEQVLLSAFGTPVPGWLLLDGKEKVLKDR